MTSNFIEIHLCQTEIEVNWGGAEISKNTTDGKLQGGFLIVDDAFCSRRHWRKKSCVFSTFFSLHKALIIQYVLCVCVCIDRRCWGRIWKTALEMHWCYYYCRRSQRSRRRSSTTQWKAHLKNPLQNCILHSAAALIFHTKSLKLSLILWLASR